MGTNLKMPFRGAWKRAKFQAKLDCDEEDINEFINVIFEDTYNTVISKKGGYVLGDSVLEDAGWDHVTQKLSAKCATLGGKKQMQLAMSASQMNMRLANDRKSAYRIIGKTGARTLHKYISNCLSGEDEKAVLWLMDNDVDPAATPFSSLYMNLPLPFVNDLIDSTEISVWGYHMYKMLVAPTMGVTGPLWSLISPYIMMRRRMAAPVSFKVYMSMVKAMLLHGLRRMGPHQIGTKALSAVLYVIFYITGMIRTFEDAYVLHKLRIGVKEMIVKVSRWIIRAEKMIKVIPREVYAPFLIGTQSIEHNLTPIIKREKSPYVLFRELCARKIHVRSLMEHIYAIDVAVRCTDLANKWTTTVKCTGDEDDVVIFENMGHPGLGRIQVTNPAVLKKPLVVTGPNAGGKSTYTRAIMCNVLLASCLGIACATHAMVPPIRCIMSHMRMQDIAGASSLFEAECRRCKDIMDEVQRTADEIGGTALVFLDEPMSSTNPIEGAAAAMSFIKNLSEIRDTRVVATTHYHHVCQLDGICNVSVDAIINNNANPFNDSEEHIVFPYKVRSGMSTQCIALELMRNKGLPGRFIDDAIEIKKSLCAQIFK